MPEEKPVEKLRSVFKELYEPEFVSRDLDLKAFYDIAEKEAEEDVKNILGTIRSFEAGDKNTSFTGRGIIDKPITEEEAQVIEGKKKEVLDRCKRVRGSLDEQFEKIDEVAVNWSHTFDLKRRPRLRKAIQRVFGEKKSTITYLEYRELLKRKKALEAIEAADLLKEEEEETGEDSGLVSKILEDLV